MPTALAPALFDQVEEGLKDVIDPELGVNIVYYSLKEKNRWLHKQQTDSDDPAKKTPDESANPGRPPARKDLIDLLKESKPEPQKEFPMVDPFNPKKDDPFKDTKK